MITAKDTVFVKMRPIAAGRLVEVEDIVFLNLADLAQVVLCRFSAPERNDLRNKIKESTLTFFACLNQAHSEVRKDAAVRKFDFRVKAECVPVLQAGPSFRSTSIIWVLFCSLPTEQIR